MASGIVPLREIVLVEDLTSCVFVRSSPLKGKQSFVFNFSAEEMAHIFTSLNIFLKDNEGNRLEVDNIKPNSGIVCSVNILGGESFNNVIDRAKSIFPNGGIEDVIKFLLGSEVKVTYGDGKVEQGIIVSYTQSSRHRHESNPKKEITLFSLESKSISSIDYENISSVIPICKTKLEEFEYYLSALPLIQQGKNWQVLINSEVVEGNYSIHCEYSIPMNLAHKIYYQLDIQKSKLSCRILLTNSTMESWENVIVKTNFSDKTITNPSSIISILPGYSSMILICELNTEYSICHAPKNKFINFKSNNDVGFSNGELTIIDDSDRYVVDSSFCLFPKTSSLVNLYESSLLKFTGTKTNEQTITKKIMRLDKVEHHTFEEITTAIKKKKIVINVMNSSDKPLRACMKIEKRKNGNPFGKQADVTCSVSHKINKSEDLFFTVPANETVKVTFSYQYESTSSRKGIHLTEELLNNLSKSNSPTSSCESFKKMKNLLELSETLANMKSKCDSLQRKLNKEFKLYKKLGLENEKQNVSKIIDDLVSEERTLGEQIESTTESMKQISKKLSNDVIPIDFDATPTITTSKFNGSNPVTAYTNRVSTSLPKTSGIFGNDSHTNRTRSANDRTGGTFFGSALPSSSNNTQGGLFSYGSRRSPSISENPFGSQIAEDDNEDSDGLSETPSVGFVSTFDTRNRSSSLFGSRDRASFSFGSGF